MRVLDACCGGRMFWFDKRNSNAVFADVRSFAKTEIWRKGDDSRSFEVLPDVKADYRALPFADGVFDHVVFDPPHLKRRHGKGGWIAIHYGTLAETWKDDIKRAFAECFRVLRTGGTLVFKWSEAEIPVAEVLRLSPVPALYGQRGGKNQNTHWVSFIK